MIRSIVISSAGAAVVFIAFTLVKTKLPHYTLPAFPLLALLLAKALLDFPEAQRFVRRNALIAATLGLLAAAATPFVARFFASADLARQVGRDLTPEMDFGASRYREPSLVWYFRKHTKGWLLDLQEVEVRPFMELPGARFVIVHTELARSLYPVIPAGWKTYSARGVNVSVGKQLELTLLLKPF